MKNHLEKSAGVSLIIGSIFMIITMALHPVGGSIEQLIRISTLAIATHTIAIISVPFSLFGFWGLTRRLGTDKALSMAAFITAGIGLGAAILAAAVNGLALPFFIQGYENADTQTHKLIDIVLSYNFSLNHAFDYILIGGICEAFLLWSIVMIKTGTFPKWIAYLGILIGMGYLLMLILGFVLVDLHGFRVFIFGIVIWIIVVGFYLRKAKP